MLSTFALKSAARPSPKDAPDAGAYIVQAAVAFSPAEGGNRAEPAVGVGQLDRNARCVELVAKGFHRIVGDSEKGPPESPHAVLIPSLDAYALCADVVQRFTRRF
jgi:hypothetical protein